MFRRREVRIAECGVRSGCRRRICLIPHSELRIPHSLVATRSFHSGRARLITRLLHRRLLDPRPADAAAALPIRDAVNIPLAEMTERMHELPPVDRVIEIANVDESAGAAR